MKKLISLITTLSLIFTTISFLPAEELTSGDKIPEQSYVYQVPETEEVEALTEELEDGVSEISMVSDSDASGTCGDNVTWKLSNGVLSISGTGEMKNYSTVGYLPWYSYRTEIQSVIIGDGVTSISDFAFDGCGDNLTTVTLPDSIEKIGKQSFYDCVSLKSIKLPSGLLTIGGYAFSGCSSLTEIVLPSSMTGIGVGTFENCSNLATVTIKGSLTGITDYAFHHCSKLKSITIPDSVTYIGVYAFAGCVSLTEITMPNRLTMIRERAFNDCDGLTELTLPDGLTKIEDYAFCECRNLRKIIVPKSVTSIGTYAFNGYYGQTIWGYRGSYAEQYASGNNIPFVPIEHLPTATPTPKPTATPTPKPTATPTPAMEKPTITFVYNSQKGGDIRWKKGGKGVTGYVVYRQRSAEGIKKVATIKDVNTLQCIDPGIVTGCWGRVYHYYICYLYGSKEGPKSDKLVLQRLAPMKITSLKNSAAGKVTCTYACTVNENKALGYEIQYAQTKQDLFERKGTFKKVSVSGRKNLSKVISGFTKGKTYYFRVRCYVDYEHSITHQKTKTWSQYSEVKSIKISK